MQFGLKIDCNSVVYVELFGLKPAKVKMVSYDPLTKKTNRDDHLYVNWEEVDKYRIDNYRVHMPVILNLSVDDHEDIELTQYQAVNYIKEHLNDGNTVLIQGSLQIVEYKDKAAEKFIAQRIYLTDSIDFDSNKYERLAFFDQEIVYKTINFDDKTEKYKIDSNIIYKQTDETKFVSYDFTIESGHDDLINYFESLNYGDTVKVHGVINVETPIMIDSDGNRYISGLPVRELIVTGANAQTLQRSRYNENDFDNLLSQKSLFEVEIPLKIDDSPF